MGLDAPSSADIRSWSQVNFAEYQLPEDPLESPVAETTLAAETTFPVASFDVGDASALTDEGKLWIADGVNIAVVSYSSKAGNTISGGSGGSGTFRAGSRVQQYADDPLDIALWRSISEYLDVTGYAFADVTDLDAHRVREVIQYLVEYKVTSTSQEVVETGADYDMIGAFSAGNYSETRRQDNRRRLVIHPVPKIAALLSDLMTEEKRNEINGFDAPAVSEPDDPADWRVADNIMRSGRYWDPAFGPIKPPWY